MRNISISSYRHLWYMVPVLALASLILPEHSCHDPGMEQLAAVSITEPESNGWKPIDMHPVSDIGMQPLALQRKDHALLSGSPASDSKPVYHSFMVKDTSKGILLYPTQKIAKREINNSLMSGSASEEDLSEISFSKPGWLSESVMAAEQDRRSLDSRISPDLADALRTDVFGRNNNTFGQSLRSNYEFGDRVFDDTPDDRKRSFDSPGIFDTEENNIFGSDLFPTEEGVE